MRILKNWTGPIKRKLHEACHPLVEVRRTEAKAEVERLSPGSRDRAVGAEPQCFRGFTRHSFTALVFLTAVFGCILRPLARVWRFA